MECLKIMYTRNNEEAVSPVIGVILMVAITVILAAVIAAFVFGMAGNIQKTKVVACTEQRINSSYVQITYQGGQDAGTLGSIYFTVNGVNATMYPQASGNYYAGGQAHETLLSTNSVLPVGATVTASAPATSHLVGVGQFTDGTTQVLVDTNL